MGVNLMTVSSGVVSAENDAAIQNFFAGGRSGILSGVIISALSGNSVKVSNGYLLIMGRLAEVEETVVSAALVSENTAPGKIWLEINLGDAENPASIRSAAGKSLPELVQEDLSAGGSIYQMELAAYTAGTTAVSGLTPTAARLASPKGITVAETEPELPAVGDLWAW